MSEVIFEKFISSIPGLISIGAGVYLASSQTADPNSYLQTIAHGIGFYFIGKGLYMIAMLLRQREFSEWNESRSRRTSRGSSRALLLADRMVFVGRPGSRNEVAATRLDHAGDSVAESSSRRTSRPRRQRF
jgi:hypothetical protein